MRKKDTTPRGLRGGPQLLAACAAAGLLLSTMPAHAVQFSLGHGVRGSFDTTITLGLAYRTHARDKSLIGKANLVPPAPQPGSYGILPPTAPQPGAGTPQFDAYINGPGSFEINKDDGDLNYPVHSWISQEIKVNHQLSLSWRNYGMYVQGYYFYDFTNSNFKNNPLTANAQHGQTYRSDAAEKRIGHRGQLLASYVYGNWQLGQHPLNVRVGNQVVNWGESTFLLFGINRVNPYDVAAYMKPGAKVKDVLLPVPMVFSSFGVTQNLSVAGFYQWSWRKTYPGPSGSYFSSADPAGVNGRWINLSFGRFRDGQYLATPRTASKTPPNHGMYGLKLDYMMPNGTEVAAYAEKLNSTVPFVSFYAANPNQGLSGPNITGHYFTDYPSDINTYGLSFNTMGPRGWSLAGELSYTPDQPMQVDTIEETLAALSPLTPLYQPGYFANQIGQFQPGQYVKGYRRHGWYQLDLTGIQIYGSNNWINANSILLVIEAGADYASGLPSRNVFRFDAPMTGMKGGNQTLNQANGDFVATPLSQPNTDFANAFAWGFRLLVQPKYFRILGSSWTFKPTLFYSQDVNGTTPGPMRNFVKGNKNASLMADFDYQKTWDVSIGYNAYWGKLNYLRDRNYVSASVSYSF